MTSYIPCACVLIVSTTPTLPAINWWPAIVAVGGAWIVSVLLMASGGRK